MSSRRYADRESGKRRPGLLWKWPLCLPSCWASLSTEGGAWFSLVSRYRGGPSISNQCPKWLAHNSYWRHCIERQNRKEIQEESALEDVSESDWFGVHDLNPIKGQEACAEAYSNINVKEQIDNRVDGFYDHVLGRLECDVERNENAIPDSAKQDKWVPPDSLTVVEANYKIRLPIDLIASCSLSQVFSNDVWFLLYQINPCFVLSFLYNFLVECQLYCIIFFCNRFLHCKYFILLDCRRHIHLFQLRAISVNFVVKNADILGLTELNFVPKRLHHHPLHFFDCYIIA